LNLQQEILLHDFVLNSQGEAIPRWNVRDSVEQAVKNDGVLNQHASLPMVRKNP
jgi:hypothetical protein